MRLSSAQIKILVSFETTYQFFFKFCNLQSSVLWGTTPLYFLSWNFIYFEQKEPIKVQIWWNQKSEIWHFDGLLSSKWYKVSAKKVQKSYLSWHWRMMRSLKKNWPVVSNMTWGILWSFTQPLKSPKLSLQWAIFVYSIWGLR